MFLRFQKQLLIGTILVAASAFVQLTKIQLPIFLKKILYFTKNRKIDLRLSVLIIQKWISLKISSFCSSRQVYRDYLYDVFRFPHPLIICTNANRFSENCNYCRSRKSEYLWNCNSGRPFLETFEHYTFQYVIFYVVFCIFYYFLFFSYFIQSWVFFILSFACHITDVLKNRSYVTSISSKVSLIFG